MRKPIKNEKLAHIERNAALLRTRERMGEQYSANQTLGRTQTIGCTAVEITQRCNLDCTLCYLSEHSESVQDIPIEEVYRRLEEVRSQYGKGVHVQITGGDPTLRKHSELIEIVSYARRIGLYPALFTNGIAASRKLLVQLAAVGLSDVAFHVDTTQRRQGYDTEADLNVVRREYLDRAQGLGLMIIFNTTVHRDNFYQLPDLVRFFVNHANKIGLVSFQLQADTGRGEWGKRVVIISQETVRGQIEQAAGRRLPWDVVRIGHPECHSYMPIFAVNNNIYPVIEKKQWFNDFLHDFLNVEVDRHSSNKEIFCSYGLAILKQPKWMWRGFQFLMSKIWQAKADLIRCYGRVHKLSFFIHNFMDAKNLDQERIDACSFMVMTSEGPVSMCAHNAKRDEYILKPITVMRADGTKINFNPLAKSTKAITNKGVL